MPKGVRGRAICSVEGCDKFVRTGGYCNAHYLRLLNYGRLEKQTKQVNRCSVEGCDGKYFAKGYCSKHYSRMRNNGTLELKPAGRVIGPCCIPGCTRDDSRLVHGMCMPCYSKMHRKKRKEATPTAMCSVEGCGRWLHANGLCDVHNARMSRYGRLDTVMTPKGAPKEFLDSLDPNEKGCILWPFCTNSAGYGDLGWEEYSSAHRYAYEKYVGEIPVGLVLRHKCDVPACVNPSHLEVGTMADNLNDMMLRDRCGRTKLNNQKVMEIIASRHLPAKELAEKFGVSRYVIHNIWRGITWKHLPRGEVKCTS